MHESMGLDNGSPQKGSRVGGVWSGAKPSAYVQTLCKTAAKIDCLTNPVHAYTRSQVCVCVCVCVLQSVSLIIGVE